MGIGAGAARPVPGAVPCVASVLQRRPLLVQREVGRTYRGAYHFAVLLTICLPIGFVPGADGH